MKIIPLAAGILILLLGAGCQHNDKAKHEEATFLVTSPVQKDTTLQHEYVCQIRSIQHIELRALEKGYLKDVFVDEGQAVRKGQILFKVMPLIYEAEVGRARSEANYAQIEYTNTKKLADSNIVSQSELALVGAKRDRANAELNLALTHLGFTEIRAPFDGIIGKFQVRQGSLLDEGELLSTLSDNSKVWVYFNVSEAEYLNYTSAGTLDSLPKVRLHLANNSIFEYLGVIETIEADFNNENGNIAFRATFPNPKGQLRHGETGNIHMPVLLKNALLIPQKATYEILDKKYVFVVDSNQILEARQISIGQEMPHLYTVTAGLKVSDRILVEGLRRVKNKQQINSRFRPQHLIIADLLQLQAE